jgi:hypothetical protein
MSDYYLTIYSARGYREIGHFQFENSFELTPQYQNDVNGLKPVSKLHLTLLVAYSISIVLIWWLTSISKYIQWSYSLYLGMFLLLEVAIHMRHFRNIFVIGQVRKHGGVDGQITYRQWLMYSSSANEFYITATLFLFVAALTFSLFFLGGAIMCYATGLKHGSLAKKTQQVKAAVQA